MPHSPTATGTGDLPGAGLVPLLTTLLADLLGTEIEPDQDFFAAGGDSLTAIQLCSAAGAQGLELRLADVLVAPTVQQWADLLADRAAGDAPAAASGTAESARVPLTPTLHDFLEEFGSTRHHRNLVGVFRPLPAVGELELPAIDLAALERALARLVARRDSFRLRIRPDGAGWRQESVAAGAAVVPVERYRYEGEPADGPAYVEELASAAQRRLDLGDGPTGRVLAVESPGFTRLVLILHHLVADGLSWPLLVGELGEYYEQERAGLPVELPAAGSFADWAAAAVGRAGRPEARAEQQWWVDQPWEQAAPLPLDHPELRGSSTAAAEVFEWTELDPARTAALAEAVRRRPELTLPDVLLAALAAACDWAEGRPVLLKTVGHGRPAWPGTAPEATTGWFSTHCPLLLPTGGADSAERLAAAVAARTAVGEGGTGFGLARYLGPPEVRAELAARVSWDAAIDFNYLGTLRASAAGPFEELDEPAGRIFDPAHLVPCPIRLTSYLAEGSLVTRWMTSGPLWERSTVHRMQRRYLAALEDLAALLGAETAHPAAVADQADGADHADHDERTTS
ncbi:hypothetical protein CFP65_5855 [Kitasatospora sp. MMS16-BH015]|uniref:condensation domain-containing protein n=1 Tax=Kitasatospora sp. MMS16-BH015 TaxID=2018025 RepID=UPI000CA34A13|nr:condensation domain-containing protein [Kitasatospora sp. MMS16-BH015]AUG80536.1 hypothetical protein CFP65_5855 [Kitasatospora sp. MMS16-BH015]